MGSVIIDDINDLPDSIKMQHGNLSLPLFKDKQHIITQHAILSEYLDDRYPFPPIMPVEPLKKAEIRLFVHHICIEWLTCVSLMEKTPKKLIFQQAQKKLVDTITAYTPLFRNKFISGEMFSIADCVVLPILWRLKYFGIQLPAPAQPVLEYAKRHFDTPYFRNSISSEEAKMSAGHFLVPSE